jgi:hypothetical protein
MRRLHIRRAGAARLELLAGLKRAEVIGALGLGLTFICLVFALTGNLRDTPGTVRFCVESIETWLFAVPPRTTAPRTVPRLDPAGTELDGTNMAVRGLTREELETHRDCERKQACFVIMWRRWPYWISGLKTDQLVLSVSDDKNCIDKDFRSRDDSLRALMSLASGGKEPKCATVFRKQDTPLHVTVTRI